MAKKKKIVQKKAHSKSHLHKPVPHWLGYVVLGATFLAALKLVSNYLQMY